MNISTNLYVLGTFSKSAKVQKKLKRELISEKSQESNHINPNQ